MSESLIIKVFKIIGILLISYILFYMIFSTNGQNLLWNAGKSAVENTWNESTMNNGGDRTLIYENFFESVENETSDKYAVD